MTYRVLVSCADCTAVDAQGCFDGSFGWVTRDGDSYRVDGFGPVAEWPEEVHAQAVADDLEDGDEWPAAWTAEAVVVGAAATT